MEDRWASDNGEAPSGSSKDHRGHRGRGGSGGSGGPEGRTAEGVDHLQAAAHELIAAARVFLDTVEDLIDEPEWVTNSVSGIVDAVKDLAGRRNDPWVAHAYSTSNESRTAEADPGDSQAGESASQSEFEVVDLTLSRVERSGAPGVGDPVKTERQNKQKSTAAGRKSRAKASSSVKRISVD